MATETPARPLPWWQLQRLEQAALLVGAALGLVSAGPLVWLSAEAQRIGHTELTAGSDLYPRALLLAWACGAVVGGCSAAWLCRRMATDAAARRDTLGHVLNLLGGSLASMLFTGAVLFLVAFAVTRHATNPYFSAVGMVGWQPGIISFVFLYTFRLLERRRAL